MGGLPQDQLKLTSTNILAATVNKACSSTRVSLLLKGQNSQASSCTPLQSLRHCKWNIADSNSFLYCKNSAY